MGFDLMKKIKQMCKGCIDDDDICIFVVAAILGFLLCVFLRTNEPFSNFAPFNEGENDVLIEHLQDDKAPVLGLQTKQKKTENVPPSLQNDYQKIQQNTKQYCNI